MIDFRCTFLVVTSGKPSARSKRIWWPNTLRVPVPVRSALAVPCLEHQAQEILVRRTESARGQFHGVDALAIETALRARVTRTSSP